MGGGDNKLDRVATLDINYDIDRVPFDDYCASLYVSLLMG